MRKFWLHKYKRTTIWLWLFIGILAGLGLAHSWADPGPGVAVCLMPFLGFWFSKRSLITIILITLLGLFGGWWRGAIHMQKLARFNQLDHQMITLTAVANSDAVYGKTKQLTFDAHGIILNNGEELAGQIQLSGYGVNAVFEGDVVQVEGKMYPGYGAYQGKISFAKIRVLEHHPSIVTNIKRRFVAGTQSALPEPLAPFVMGLLVGQRATLPANVKEDLQKVGLTHIIAVSGANLTIILQASQKLLGKRSKRISTGLTAALIMVFLVLSGASASIVRAAIVSMLSIAAGYYGRSFKPLNLITFAAVITAWANPVYLWSDLSWYLSFLAFCGVMVLSPLVQARWPRKWHESIIGGVAMESLCAEAMTLPFVLHIFGQMSRVGLIANVLVVAFIPLAMLLGAIAGLGGMLLGNFGGWFAWPAILLLNYMLDTAHLLANLPNIFVEGIGLSLAQMLIIYASLCIVITALWFKNDGKSAIITDINDSKVRGLLT
jgi:ComEC/Rec2-related protein